MKKLIAGLALVGALWMVAGSAQADPVAGMTCGNNGDGSPGFTSQLFHDSNGWSANYDNNCGQGKTFMLEIQYSNDGGNHWYDATGHTIKTSGPCGSGCPMTMVNKTLGCSNSLDYRAKVWSYLNNADWTLNWLGC